MRETAVRRVLSRSRETDSYTSTDFFSPAFVVINGRWYGHRTCLHVRIVARKFKTSTGYGCSYTAYDCALAETQSTVFCASFAYVREQRAFVPQRYSLPSCSCFGPIGDKQDLLARPERYPLAAILDSRNAIIAIRLTRKVVTRVVARGSR